MKKIYLVVLGALFCSSCYATTCVQDEEESAALRKYLEESAEITILGSNNSDSERLVVFRIPLKFNEYLFSSLALRRDKQEKSDEIDFWIPLEQRKEENFSVSNFNMSRELLRGAKIEITFNKYEECGISTELELASGDY
jgi:hypothetical protein